MKNIDTIKLQIHSTVKDALESKAWELGVLLKHLKTIIINFYSLDLKISPAMVSKVFRGVK